MIIINSSSLGCRTPAPRMIRKCDLSKNWWMLMKRLWTHRMTRVCVCVCVEFYTTAAVCGVLKHPDRKASRGQTEICSTLLSTPLSLPALVCTLDSNRISLVQLCFSSTRERDWMGEEKREEQHTRVWKIEYTWTISWQRNLEVVFSKSNKWGNGRKSTC